jgi:hypothetical protein
VNLDALSFDAVASDAVGQVEEQPVLALRNGERTWCRAPGWRRREENACRFPTGSSPVIGLDFENNLASGKLRSMRKGRGGCEPYFFA